MCALTSCHKVSSCVALSSSHVVAFILFCLRLTLCYLGFIKLKVFFFFLRLRLVIVLLPSLTAFGTIYMCVCRPAPVYSGQRVPAHCNLRNRLGIDNCTSKTLQTQRPHNNKKAALNAEKCFRGPKHSLETRVAILSSFIVDLLVYFWLKLRFSLKLTLCTVL